MIKTIEGNHKQNMKELIDYLLREKESRWELSISNSRNKERAEREQAMCDNYRRFAEAAIFYSNNSDA